MKAAIILSTLAFFAAAYPASTMSKISTHPATSIHPGVADPVQSSEPSEQHAHPSDSAEVSFKPSSRPRPFGGLRFGKYEGSHGPEHGSGGDRDEKEHGHGGYGKPHGHSGYGAHGGNGGDQDDFEHQGKNDTIPCSDTDKDDPPVSSSTPVFEVPHHSNMDVTAAVEIPLPTSVFVSSAAGSTLTISVTNSHRVTLTRPRPSIINADEAFGNVATSVPVDPHHGTHVMSTPAETTHPSAAAPHHQAEPTRPFIDIDGMSIDDRHPDFDSLTPEYYDENGDLAPRPNPSNTSTSTTTRPNANGGHVSAGSIQPTPPPAKPEHSDAPSFVHLTPEIYDEFGHPTNHTASTDTTKPPTFDHLTPEVYDEFGKPANHSQTANATAPSKPHHPGAPFLNTTMITSTIPAEPTKFTILPVPLSVNATGVPVLPNATVSVAPSRPLNTSTTTVIPNLARVSVVPYGEIDRRDPHCETKCDRTYRKCLDENCDAAGSPRIGRDGLLTPCVQVCITHTCLVSPEFACRKLCGYEGQCGGPVPFVPFLLDHNDIVYESLVSQWPKEEDAVAEPVMANAPSFGNGPVV